MKDAKKIVFLIAPIVVSVVGEGTSQELGIEQIRIGIIVPLNGPIAARAQAFQGAVQMALEDVANKSGLR